VLILQLWGLLRLVGEVVLGVLVHKQRRTGCRVGREAVAHRGIAAMASEVRGPLDKVTTEGLLLQALAQVAVGLAQQVKTLARLGATEALEPLA
jgi:hypothetical protein